MNFIMPIFMLFLIDKGLSSFQIFLTQAFYTITELGLNVPSGAFADKVGRKKTIVLSTVLYSGAFIAYGFADSFAMILFAELVFAISSAMFHGTGEAFLYDTLAEAGRKKQFNKVMGNAFAIQSVVMGLSAVGGGLLAKYDLALPFFVSAFPVALSMIPLFFLDEPRRTKETASYLKLMKDSTIFVVKHKRLRNVMYFISVTTLAGFIGWMLYQPLLTNMGMRVEYLGIVMMALSLSHALGNKLAGFFDKKFSNLNLMFLFTGFRALLFLLVYLASGFYLIVWAVLIDLIGGLASPLVADWINRYSKSGNRATVLSITMMSGNLAFTLFSPLFGLYIDAYSEHAVYLLLAIIMGAYALRQLAILAYGRISRKAA
jgi:MFS family permease